MSSKSCYAPLQLCALRVAQLNASGAPLAGAKTGYSTDAIIEAKVGVTVEKGDSFSVKNGCGSLAHSYDAPDQVKSSTVDLTLSNFDFELLSLLIGNSSLLTDQAGAGVGDPLGWQMASTSAGAGNGVCLEMWSKAWDSSSAAIPALSSPNAVYYHWVFPKVLFTLSDVPLANEFTKLVVNGVGSENAALTINGPFDDWPADVALQGGISRTFGVFFDSGALPTVASNCGRIAVTSAS